MKIVGIDPGHGGKDPGAVGPTGLKEKDINLSVSLMLADLLESNGIKPILTRNNDTTMSLSERSKKINHEKCGVSVSIHCNSVANPSANYCSTWIGKSDDPTKLLAIYVQRHLAQDTGFRDGGVKSNEKLHMVAAPTMPAILVEMAFISNPEQEKWLRDKDNHYVVARAIAKGICDHFYLGFTEPGGDGMFKDVRSDKWYAEVVERAAELGLMAGASDSKFEPDRPVTRAELAAVAVRIYEKLKK